MAVSSWRRRLAIFSRQSKDGFHLRLEPVTASSRRTWILRAAGPAAPCSLAADMTPHPRSRSASVGQRTVHAGQRTVHARSRTAHAGQRTLHAASRTAHAGSGTAHAGERTVHAGARTVHAGQRTLLADRLDPDAVQRAAQSAPAAVQDVGVDHGRRDVLVTQELLYRSDVIAGSQEMGREAMAQRATTCGLRNAGFPDGLFDRPLEGLLVEVMAAH